MFDITTPEVQFAVNTVEKASALVRQVQHEMVAEAIVKEDSSPVTVADFGAQALVARELQRAFPDDPLVGEEDSTTLREPESRETLDRISHFVSAYTPGATPEAVCEWIDHGSTVTAPRYWTVDPIDGTKGFLRGEQYAVAFGLVENGIVQVGVLGCPNLLDAYMLVPGGLGTLVVAVRGQGTWTRQLFSPGAEYRQLKVSTRREPARMRLLRSVESGHTNVGKIGDLVNALGVKASPVLLDSQAKYAVLAAGQAEVNIRMLSDKRPDYKEKIWDQAAGSIVVEEAGGKVTDLHGKALDFTQGRTLAGNRGVLGTNGAMHGAVLRALEKINA